MFGIHLGIPEMEELWNRLEKKHQSGSATKAEEKLRRQMGKAMVLLSGNPRHPGLHSHEITSLTARYGQKVWESYLENDTPISQKRGTGICLRKNRRMLSITINWTMAG